MIVGPRPVRAYAVDRHGLQARGTPHVRPPPRGPIMQPMDHEPPTNPEGSGPALADWEVRAWRRLRAGLRVEGGLAPKGEAKRWQQAIRAGDQDPDRCADELCAPPAKGDEADKLLLRSARLQRDLVMSPLLRGAAGVSRKARAATRSGVAAVVSQVVVLAIYSMLAFLFLLVLAFKGHEFDPFFQRIIDFIPAMPTEGS